MSDKKPTPNDSPEVHAFQARKAKRNRKKEKLVPNAFRIESVEVRLEPSSHSEDKG